MIQWIQIFSDCSDFCYIAPAALIPTHERLNGKKRKVLEWASQSSELKKSVETLDESWQQESFS